MPNSAPRRILPARVWLALAVLLVVAARPLAPRRRSRAGSSSPRPQQAQEMLRTQPQLVQQLRQRLMQSGLTPDQVRSRLRAAGYPEDMLDEYLQGADTTQAGAVRPAVPSTRCARSASSATEEADSLQIVDSTGVVVGLAARRARLDQARCAPTRSGPTRWPTPSPCSGAPGSSCSASRPSAARPPVPARAGGPGGRELPARPGRRAGPHPDRRRRAGATRSRSPAKGSWSSRRSASSTSPTSRWASSRTSSTRRLGRVYSGVRRGPNATTRFQLSLARLRNIQVFVAGDVVRPGAYQMSSAGTVLTALYAAGGPTSNGSFRRVEIRRGQRAGGQPRPLRLPAPRAATRPTSGCRPATWSSSRCTADSRRWPAR